MSLLSIPQNDTTGNDQIDSFRSTFNLQATSLCVIIPVVTIQGRAMLLPIGNFPTLQRNPRHPLHIKKFGAEWAPTNIILVATT